MEHKLRLALVITGGLMLLTLAFGLVHQAIFFDPEPSFEGDLKDRIATDVPGWESQEVELADTPEMLRTTESLLNFTQAFSWQYSRRGTVFSVYVGYWAPKTMAVREVQAHTPDVCWLKNGGERLSKTHGVKLAAKGRPLFPAEHRIIDMGNGPIHTYFWHVVGNRVYVTDVNTPGKWNKWDPVISLFTFGLKQETEQFMVRVSSRTPLDAIWNDPGIQEIMADLADLAIAQDRGQPEAEGLGADAETVESARRSPAPALPQPSRS